MDRVELQKKPIWRYFSQAQKDLIEEGLYLKDDIVRDHAFQFKDYSFLIFPFAKAYEGFLKQLFKDVKFISHLDYISDHLRLGKLFIPSPRCKIRAEIALSANHKLQWRTSCRTHLESMEVGSKRSISLFSSQSARGNLSRCGKDHHRTVMHHGRILRPTPTMKVRQHLLSYA